MGIGPTVATCVNVHRPACSHTVAASATTTVCPVCVLCAGVRFHGLSIAAPRREVHLWSVHSSLPLFDEVSNENLAPLVLAMCVVPRCIETRNRRAEVDSCSAKVGARLTFEGKQDGGVASARAGHDARGRTPRARGATEMELRRAVVAWRWW